MDHAIDLRPCPNSFWLKPFLQIRLLVLIIAEGFHALARQPCKNTAYAPAATTPIAAGDGPEAVYAATRCGLVAFARTLAFAAHAYACAATHGRARA